MGRCSKKRARQNTISINTVPLLSVRHSKKICVKIKKNECSAEEKETGATGPPPSPNPTVPWPYQWTGCVGPPDQTREGEE
ncbi:hypothetical protein SERLA73DRAFT_174107 [Serpula lacrymans var. lacrymans S7.3]|uniref:Uncharacterized protein n=1 Tax=Serpula lacrymans var. lacrymans (strain S7.3) TaxID=936435 RepID=F8PIB1_SERL3|nr:hypothetical protein SERLA73DRAFT_174107 [Serpula lacrymans var. lacrymans S7.3]